MAIIHLDSESLAKDLLENIKEDKKIYETKIKALKDQIKELEDPFIKDKMIAKLTAEKVRAIEDLNRGFSISKEQEETIKNWQEYHIIVKHRGSAPSGVSGGRWTYEFTPTALGTFGTIRCTCGECYTFQEEW